MNLQQPLTVRKYVIKRGNLYLHQGSSLDRYAWTPSKDIAWIFQTRREAIRALPSFPGARIAQLELIAGTRIPAS